MAIKATNVDEDQQGLSTDSLRNVSVMNDEDMAYGLPTKIFYGGAALSIAFTLMLPWYTGVLFGTIYFTSMYTIHRDDPTAMQGWIDAALNKRKDKWSGGINKGRKIYFINKKG
ncbi:hypothetical protein [Janthinobacterium sp. MDT1-19]|uniref:hypothetical protein n=1 Tax=Janthinobacterium sp. MDT1-19 TaxID=1259339 RepID=UPI003F2030F5